MRPKITQDTKALQLCLMRALANYKKIQNILLAYDRAYSGQLGEYDNNYLQILYRLRREDSLVSVCFIALIIDWTDLYRGIFKELRKRYSYTKEDFKIIIAETQNLVDKGTEQINKVIEETDFISTNPAFKKTEENLNAPLFESTEVHDTLNPKLFNKDNTLKATVKAKINKIVDFFVQALKTDEIKLAVKDIIIIGSNASYNYSNKSDMDLHIIADSSKINCPDHLYPKLYSAYRTIFNNNYDIDFYGIPVEIYVETDETTTVSNGIYSVKNDKWIKEPVKEAIPEPDKDAFDKLFDKYNKEYEKLIEKKTLSADDVDKYIEKIYDTRKSSIAKDGEYGIGNLVFKELRNQGKLDKLKDKKKELIGQELSLNEAATVIDSNDLNRIKGNYDYERPQHGRYTKLQGEQSEIKTTRRFPDSYPIANKLDNILGAIKELFKETVTITETPYDFYYIYATDPKNYIVYDKETLDSYNDLHNGHILVLKNKSKEKLLSEIYSFIKTELNI